MAKRPLDLERYQYDEQGRLSKILDGSGKERAGYAYNAKNQIASALNAGKLRTRLKRNIREDITGREVTNADGTRYFYGEKLGYSQGIDPSLSGRVQGRRDGRITQILQQYPSTVPAPVRLWEFEYNPLGQNTRAKETRPSPPTFSASGQVNLPLPLSGALCFSEDFKLDLDARFLKKAKGECNVVREEMVYRYKDYETLPRLQDVQVTTLFNDPKSRPSGGFAFDAEGRMIRDAALSRATTYRFDARALTDEVPGTKVTYFYDGEGNRIGELEQKGASQKLVGEIDDEGKRTLRRLTAIPDSYGGWYEDKRYRYGLSEPLVAREDNGNGIIEENLLVRDYKGSLALEVSSFSLAIRRAYAYETYGNVRPLVESSNPTPAERRYRFAEGQLATGLLEMGLRDYDPTLGLFTTPDPMEEFFSGYSYVGGDPINFSDPTGLLSEAQSAACREAISGMGLPSDAYDGGGVGSGGKVSCYISPAYQSVKGGAFGIPSISIIPVGSDGLNFVVVQNGQLNSSSSQGFIRIENDKSVFTSNSVLAYTPTQAPAVQRMVASIEHPALRQELFDYIVRGNSMPLLATGERSKAGRMALTLQRSVEGSAGRRRFEDLSLQDYQVFQALVQRGNLGGGNIVLNEPSPGPSGIGDPLRRLYEAGERRMESQVAGGHYVAGMINAVGISALELVIGKDSKDAALNTGITLATFGLGRPVKKVFDAVEAMQDVSKVRNAANAGKVFSEGEGGLVIGKTKDLAADNGWRVGDRTLDLPNQGSAKANWEQNSSRLRGAMSEGQPIRDMSVDPSTGALRDNTGFLRAERNLLKTHGWKFDPGTQTWNPPSK